MKLSEYSSFDGLALAKLVRDKQVAPLDLTRLAIEAAAPLNARLNAIVEVYEDRAYGLRKDTDLMGPFTGVPLLLKDIGATEKGRPQQCGSRLGEGYIADFDSYLTQRFLGAGFNIFGRTNLPEFAQAATTENRHFGDTRNPWDLNRSAGGSSGGAGAAVAAGIVPIAHGTDAGGSIRFPAACCGLVGLKPSALKTIGASGFRQRVLQAPTLGVLLDLRQRRLAQVNHGVARRAALAPRPRLNLTRFHGVFAPNCKHRARIVPHRPRGQVDNDQPTAPMSRMRRLKRVFAIDIESCPDCGGKLRVIASIEDPPLIRHILAQVQRREALLKRVARAPPALPQTTTI